MLFLLLYFYFTVGTFVIGRIYESTFQLFQSDMAFRDKKMTQTIFCFQFLFLSPIYVYLLYTFYVFVNSVRSSIRILLVSYYVMYVEVLLSISVHFIFCISIIFYQDLKLTCKKYVWVGIEVGTIKSRRIGMTLLVSEK